MSVILVNDSTALIANETISHSINQTINQVTFHPVIDHVLDTISHSFLFNSMIPDHSTARLAVAVTLALIVATSVFIAYHFMLGSSKRGIAVLIAGPQKAGKTVLFYQLMQGKVRETVTSMQPNDATFIPSNDQSINQPIRFIDTPGHPSQRFKLLSSFPMLRSIIFMINQSHLNGSNITSTASLLYEILSHPLLQQRKLPILIVMNQSADQSANSQLITESSMQTTLERALDSKRKLISSMPDLGGDAEDLSASQRKLGNVSDEQNFTFADSPLRITCKIWSGKDNDIKQITSWIATAK